MDSSVPLVTTYEQSGAGSANEAFAFFPRVEHCTAKSRRRKREIFDTCGGVVSSRNDGARDSLCAATPPPQHRKPLNNHRR